MGMHRIPSTAGAVHFTLFSFHKLRWECWYLSPSQLHAEGRTQSTKLDPY